MLTKTWTTKADFEAGTLTNIWVPEELNRLELKRLSLSGTGVWIFDGGARKKFNWQSFERTNPNQNIYYRDDFRDNTLIWTVVGGTWNCVSQYMRGTGSSNWNVNRARLDSISWVGQDILCKSYLSGGAESHRIFLRSDHGGGNFCAYMLAVTQSQTEQARVCNGSVLENTVISSNHVSGGQWYWFRIQIYTSGGNVIGRIKWWSPGSEEPSGWKASHTWSGVWRSSGCFSVGRHTHDPGQYNAYDDFLISRMEGIPSPPNCSVSFRFAASDDGSSWSGWQTDIAKVPNGRYIKIEATLSRNSLLSAMPTLEDMTLTYKLLVQPIFI